MKSYEKTQSLSSRQSLWKVIKWQQIPLKRCIKGRPTFEFVAKYYEKLWKDAKFKFMSKFMKSYKMTANSTQTIYKRTSNFWIYRKTLRKVMKNEMFKFTPKFMKNYKRTSNSTQVIYKRMSNFWIYRKTLRKVMKKRKV